MIGTLVNTATVIVGSILGILLKSKLPKKTTDIVFQVMGIFTIYLGLRMALDGVNILLMILSLVIGAVIGQVIGIQALLERVAAYLQTKVGGEGSHFVQGFITATLLFCTGSMVILGAIEEGSGRTPTLYFTKAIMDGTTSIVLAASFGRGVLFSSFVIFFIQGLLTGAVFYFGDFLPEIVITQVGAVGGVILLGLGLTILEIKKLAIANMLPALVVAGVLSYYFL